MVTRPTSSTQSKGRAIVARPSLRLRVLGLGAALIAVLASAPVASANPLAPALKGTDPESPGLSLTPVVLGNTDGIIISSVPGALALPTSGSELSELTVRLYPNKTCEGEAFGTAPAEQFDASGIQVTVEPETTTWISGNVINAAEEVSNCSNAIAYQQVKELPPSGGEQPAEGGGGGGSSGGSGNGGTTAPPGPPKLRLLPTGVANNVTPIVAGTAPGADTVRLYQVSNCAGSPLAKLTPVELAAGFQATVPANAVTGFSAVSVGPGGASSCSTPVFYTEDSIAPHTRITMGPAAKTRRRVAVFRFSDSDGALPGTNFFCRVNKRKWTACRSPMKVKHLRPRRYLFEVRAVDPAGNLDAKPAKRRFKVIQAAR